MSSSMYRPLKADQLEQDVQTTIKTMQSNADNVVARANRIEELETEEMVIFSQDFHRHGGKLGGKQHSFRDKEKYDRTRMKHYCWGVSAAITLALTMVILLGTKPWRQSEIPTASKIAIDETTTFATTTQILPSIVPTTTSNIVMTPHMEVTSQRLMTLDELPITTTEEVTNPQNNSESLQFEWTDVKTKDSTKEASSDEITLKL